MTAELDMLIDTPEYKSAPGQEVVKPQLRMVDLNLLTVFDAVMQEQNITRAAHTLGMSQPAVSNAVSRLKVMFNDELFVRYGRGIQRRRGPISFLVLCARRCSWSKTNCRAPVLNR